MKRKYTVTVEELISQDYVVDAESREDAEETVREMFDRGDFAMDGCDVLERSYVVYDENQKEETR